MNERGDSDLLREYAQDKSPDAFGRLVARYAGLVYSAALRHVREGHAAEDVAQAAFIVLARRASTLKRGCVLGGWLLAVTRHTARDYLKMERRRKQREQAVAMEKERQSAQQDTGDAGADSTLDDALARLSTASRDAIVLRFLREKSFGEMAALFGISEDSARQRVSRALEKLRKIMSRQQGAQVSSQSLGALLATAATTVPPDGLVVKLTTTALNSGTAAGVPAVLAKGAVAVMAYSKAKAVAVGALAFLLVGGGAATVGYYVTHGEEPTAMARPDPAAPAPQNAVPNFGYNWGGPPASRPVYQGPPVAGFVVDGNGKPVAGAAVTYGWERVYASVFLNQTNQGGVSARTNPDGHFQFIPRNGKPESIAVQTEDGFGMAKASELPKTPIRIVPWGRIEGVAKVGKNPAANARIGLRFNTRSNDGPLVYISGSTQTDQDGRFVFEKAPPGPGRSRRDVVRPTADGCARSRGGAEWVHCDDFCRRDRTSGNRAPEFDAGRLCRIRIADARPAATPTAARGASLADVDAHIDAVRGAEEAAGSLSRVAGVQGIFEGTRRIHQAERTAAFSAATDFSRSGWKFPRGGRSCRRLPAQRHAT